MEFISFTLAQEQTPKAQLIDIEYLANRTRARAKPFPNSPFPSKDQGINDYSSRKSQDTSMNRTHTGYNACKMLLFTSKPSIPLRFSKFKEINIQNL